jgi:predicted permease
MQDAMSGILAVAVIFVLIGVGIFAAWRKWLPPEAARALPRLIVDFGLPCNVVTSLYNNFVVARESGASVQSELVVPWLPLLIAFGTLLISFGLAQLAARVLRIPETRRGVFAVLFSFSNSVFIGFPVAQALFPDGGMTYAVYYYLANTTTFWVAGYLMIRRDADRLRGETSRIGVGEVAKKLVTVPLISILVMFGVIVSGLHLPKFVLTVCEYGGGLTTPLSLIFTGCMIFEAGRRSIRYEKGIGAVLLGRFVLNPAMCIGVCAIVFSLIASSASAAQLKELTLMRNVLTVQMGLPVMTQSVIVSQRYGADALYATRGVVWTTLASLVTIPLTVLVFQVI